MHEMGIIENIFKVVEEVAAENKLTTINKVKLKVGKMRQVVPEMLESAFAAVAEHTKAKGAVLEVEYVPIVMKCRECAEEFEVEEQVYICPACEKTDLEVLSGQEVMLDSVEGDLL